VSVLGCRVAASFNNSFKPKPLCGSVQFRRSAPMRNIIAIRDALNTRHPLSLRAFKPLAARPKAVAGSNPAS